MKWFQLARQQLGLEDAVLNAVVNLKSTLVTNADAAQQTLNAQYNDGGRLREKSINQAIANGDSATSTYRMFRCHSSWRVSSILESHADIGTTTTADIGLYDTVGNGGAVVDADFFASAIVLNAGAVDNADVTYESGVVAVANRHKRIWEQLGLSADPNKYYDVALTLVGAADGAGDVNLRMRYSDGN